MQNNNKRISYGEYSFVVHALINCRQLLLYIFNDKNHLYKFVTSKDFLVAIRYKVKVNMVG